MKELPCIALRKAVAEAASSALRMRVSSAKAAAASPLAVVLEGSACWPVGLSKKQY